MNQPTSTPSADEARVNPSAKPDRPTLRQRALQEELRSLMDVVTPAPLVDLLLERSFELGATDIHFDPWLDGIHIRLRLDGILHDVLTIEPNIGPQVISRIKLLAGMDITERRLAQDGHISNAVLRHRRDIRVGSGPTIHGERLVLRLMPDNTTLTTLDSLGFEPEQLEIVNRAIHSPYGMILSVGPVGCGKSTTMYACLNLLNVPGRSLVTIEDPVERRIVGVNQIQIETKIGFGFVEALRGVLRQDPDVMMVGEIRDPETAQIAARAGLSGIRVLSTLHASRAGAVLDVFRQFSVPPMFVADSLNAIIAQRLLRKVCSESREYYQPDEATSRILKLTPEQQGSVRIARGIPADVNFHTGYFGRTGVFEVLGLSDELRQMILDGKSGDQIAEAGRKMGMISLEDALIRKVLAGITSVEEMHHVLAD
jgi:type II secretory ATPase GspE/PulE/Tfp pilus assembly ATPase PilB-like protein